MKTDIVIEISKNSKIKYEIGNGRLKVDRIIYGAMNYPANYGYFEKTLDWDGDPLDALVISDQKFLPTSIVPVRIIGAIKMIDNGETDTKIITVVNVDPRFDNINNLNDLNKNILLEFKDFFENYKNLQNKKVEILGFEDIKFAENEIKEAKELYQKYHHLQKNKFISEMKKKYPNKYK
ncbi:inorganic diphosphatase [Candidatus Hepatoplasma crinochetorum]|uniref:inorganic diphosphatase n=1 Tax=Candidatus Hepatoplasma crinochetorum TaxID=295596 RepID=UPI0030857C0F|nr:MAG: inorganic pyrophosphatase [Candidatus Hepatoplasma crinochetorum]